MVKGKNVFTMTKTEIPAQGSDLQENVGGNKRFH